MCVRVEIYRTAKETQLFENASVSVRKRPKTLKENLLKVVLILWLNYRTCTFKVWS